MKRDWEIIADNLSKAGWSWGCSSDTDSTGRVIFTADAYGRDGRRFTVLADERLTAFLEVARVTGVAPRLLGVKPPNSHPADPSRAVCGA